ncbi:MAG: High-affinity nickel-transporter [Candidatus Gottesmanbacteria bacterium GW2011_GWC2_39_8]|uniref:Nickel/cobalt efflux system n=1 Tax=Candidatus Gottesmanbacteria bacterium GW2011_GWC2_39_8 TaxID=1618450 RepID=A0A0G0PX14_9BACT|nr:MAG: High-affinity nickel-transporter [Candidatus Gottesmanbacteria bacterium GW2011_GWC2_39_8]
MNLSLFFLFATALALGLRHGIDWDHIAAITDITGSSKNTRQSFLYGTIYALGHATVIIVLGILAVLVGVRLPSWVDNVMEPLVGITLILLSVYLLFSLIRYRKDFRVMSRWMLLFRFAAKIFDFIHKKSTHSHEKSHFHYPENFGVRTSYAVGILHGIGAETPTQLLLFVTAANGKGSIIGSLLVIIFVLGLVLSNSLITILSTLGYRKFTQSSPIYMAFAGVTAIFSFIVGITFLLGKATVLPAILGG